MHPHELPHPSPPLSAGPADRARIALLDHHAEPDRIVAKLADASPAIVQRARAELQAAGHIPARDPELSPDAYSAGPLSASQRAGAELLADPARSNLIISDLASCHVTTVLKVRRQLEASGAIPAVDRWERRRRPGSGKGSQRQQRTGPAESDLDRHITLTPPQPPSMRSGLCVTGGHPPDLWHPGRGGGDRGQQAIAICRRCPALDDCAAWSLNLTSKDRAIYGGMTASERHRKRQQLPAGRGAHCA